MPEIEANLCRCAAFASLVFLVGCATPFQQCANTVSSEYNLILSAAQQSAGNIARGYAVHSQSVPYQYSSVCYNAAIGSYACMQTGYRNMDTPVAIDVREERRKLQGYYAVLPRLKKEAEAGIAQCAIQYPEK